MKFKKITIIGERVVLRRLKMDDAERIAEMLKAPEMRKGLSPLMPNPYHKKDAIKWIKNSWKKKDGYEMCIALKDSDEIIGAMSVFHITKLYDYKTAEIGYWLGKKYWGKGYASEAASLLIGHGFKKLKLHRVYAKVFAFNKLSLNLLRGLGFKDEGLMRENIVVNGKWTDEFYLGLLKKEWKK